MKLQNVLPADIENRSMEIIGEELGELKIDSEKLSIVKRVIHTSADFDYARNMRFSEGAVEKALEALKMALPLLPIPIWHAPASIKWGLLNLAPKQFALWLTLMLLQEQKKLVLPVLLPAWKKPAP